MHPFPRIRISLPTVLLTMLLAAVQGCKDRTGPEPILLLDATVYDGAGNRFEAYDLLIINGKISQMGDSLTLPDPNIETVDLTGKFVTPGLIDAHVHYFQTGFFDSRPDAIDLRDTLSYVEVQVYQKNNPHRYHEAYLRSGVTGVYDVGGFTWSISLQEKAETDYLAPHISASGPLITLAPPQFISTFNTPAENVIVYLDGSETLTRNIVAQNSLLGSTGIKLWALAPEDFQHMNILQAMKDEIEKRNNKLIVHATRLEAAKEALKLGAKLLVHSVTDVSVDQEFIELMKANDAVITPTLIVSGGYLTAMRAIQGEPMTVQDPNKVVDRQTLSLIRNATAFLDLVGEEQLQERIDRLSGFIQKEDSVMPMNLKTLYDEGVRIAVGTDAGNPGTLHGVSIFDELEAMESAGIPAGDLIVMATRNGAMAMDRSDDMGTLEVGKLGNLIVLKEDPAIQISNLRSISHVMKMGSLRLVRQKFYAK